MAGQKGFGFILWLRTTSPKGLRVPVRQSGLVSNFQAKLFLSALCLLGFIAKRVQKLLEISSKETVFRQKTASDFTRIQSNCWNARQILWSCGKCACDTLVVAKMTVGRSMLEGVCLWCDYPPLTYAHTRLKLDTDDPASVKNLNTEKHATVCAKSAPSSNWCHTKVYTQS